MWVLVVYGIKNQLQMKLAKPELTETVAPRGSNLCPIPCSQPRDEMKKSLVVLRYENSLKK